MWNADSQQTAALFAALAQAQPAANCLADNRCSAVACPQARALDPPASRRRCRARCGYHVRAQAAAVHSAAQQGAACLNVRRSPAAMDYWPPAL